MTNLQEVLAELKALKKSKGRAKAGLSRKLDPGDTQQTDEEWRKYAIAKMDEDREKLTRIIEKLEGLIG